MLINEILDGNEVGDIFFIVPYMWLVTSYLCLVSDEHLASVIMMSHLFLGLINISNQLGITE